VTGAIRAVHHCVEYAEIPFPQDSDAEADPAGAAVAIDRTGATMVTDPAGAAGAGVLLADVLDVLCVLDAPPLIVGETEIVG
jgi:hypothetical protein